MLPSAPQADQEGMQSVLTASNESFMTLLLNSIGDQIVIEIGPNLKEAIGFVALAIVIGVTYWAIFRGKW